MQRIQLLRLWHTIVSTVILIVPISVWMLYLILSRREFNLIDIKVPLWIFLGTFIWQCVYVTFIGDEYLLETKWVMIVLVLGFLGFSSFMLIPYYSCIR